MSGDDGEKSDREVMELLLASDHRRTLQIAHLGKYGTTTTHWRRRLKPKPKPHQRVFLLPGSKRKA